jgi:hypothetical protein
MQDGREALVEIKTLKLMSDRVSRRELSDALAWAAENTALLTTKWKELNS